MDSAEHDRVSVDIQGSPEEETPAVAADPEADQPRNEGSAEGDIPSLPPTVPLRKTGLHVFFMDARHALKLDELGREIAQIAVPAAMALAADPLASLVDTAFIGRIGPVELAAVGVAISVFNQVSRVAIYPLVSVTTSFVAEELAACKLSAAGESEDDQDIERTSPATAQAGGSSPPGDLDGAAPSSTPGADRNQRNRARFGQQRKYFSSVSSALVVGGVLGLLQAILLIFAGKPFLNLMGVKSVSVYDLMILMLLNRG
uniref:MATE efflux family protein 1 n=1 Tax=Anthurium amnicola TaxID=1678845 RepID=A0A1D1Y9A6_9ARAE